MKITVLNRGSSNRWSFFGHADFGDLYEALEFSLVIVLLITLIILLNKKRELIKAYYQNCKSALLKLPDNKTFNYFIKLFFAVVLLMMLNKYFENGRFVLDNDSRIFDTRRGVIYTLESNGWSESTPFVD